MAGETRSVESRRKAAGWERWRWREWRQSLQAFDHGRRFGAERHEWRVVSTNTLWDDDNPEVANHIMWAAELMQRKWSAGEMLDVREFTAFMSPASLVKAHQIGMFARPQFCRISISDAKVIAGRAYPLVPLTRMPERLEGR